MKNLILFFGGLCISLNNYAQDTTSIALKLKSEVVELKPYLGFLHVTTSENYDVLNKRTYFYSVRGGFYGIVKPTSWMKLHLDVMGELNSCETRTGGFSYIEIGKEKFNMTAGFSGTKITSFRYHFLDMGSQFESYGMSQIPRSTWNIAFNKKLGTKASLSACVAERGKSLGDSTEYSLKMVSEFGLSVGAYVLDKKPGGVLQYRNKENTFMTTSYFRENLFTYYAENYFGKKKNLMIAVDIIYDHIKGQTDYTQEKKLFGELITIYNFKSNFIKNFNVPGGIGFGIAQDYFNLYFFTYLN
jgi:hypothetical protein